METTNDDISKILKKIANVQEDIETIKKSIGQRNIPKDRYTLKEAAEISGCSTETIKNHIKAGFLSVRYPMARRKLHTDDIERYLRGRNA